MPSGAKHADRDNAKKADGRAAAAKHSADARPHKASAAAAKKESAAAAKPAGKEAQANGRVAVKKERKVFELPGQTRETPPEVSFLEPTPKFLSQCLQQVITLLVDTHSGQSSSHLAGVSLLSQRHSGTITSLLHWLPINRAITDRLDAFDAGRPAQEVLQLPARADTRKRHGQEVVRSHACICTLY